MTAHVHVFETREALCAAVAAHVAAVASSPRSEEEEEEEPTTTTEDSHRKKFVVALSGGSMPSLLIGLLETDVDFGRWEVIFADERCVPLESPDSNYKSCVDALFSKLPPGKKRPRIWPIDAALAVADPEAAARAYDTTVRGLGGCADLALLGCGPDGHTASLFPGHALYATKADEDANTCVAAILDAPKPPPRRVTLTRAALAKSRHVAYVATGASKADLLARVLVARDRAAGHFAYADPLPTDLPVATLRARNGDAYWFLDADAAKSIPDAPSASSSSSSS